MIQAFDIEVFKNFFCVTFTDIKTGDTKTFRICPWQNDYLDMLDYIQDVTGLIGYNNVGYDYPVLHPFIHPSTRSTYRHYTGAELATAIYQRSAVVTTEDWQRDFDFREDVLIPQRDLYRIWHFNNKGRSTSLKWLQINMNWHDVRESPIHYQQPVEQGAQEAEVIAYNVNDVLSTIAFYHKSKDKIRFRKTLGQKYGRDFGNSPDTKIGESIFLSVMSQITGRSIKELSSRRTPRKEMALVDCIPEGVSFRSPEFNKVLDVFAEAKITATRLKKELKNKKSKGFVSVYFDGMKYDFGFGGLHGLRAPGTYHDLDSADVGGYYPSMSVSKKIHPHHLGLAFCEAHQVIKDERKLWGKETDENKGLKLSGNGVFGMTNAEWSPFYDPLCTMKTTIGGQLLLAQLCEMLTVGGAGRIVMVNTDGFEIQLKSKQKYEKICKDWERLHGLSLEFSRFKTLAARDCNNYIGIKENGEVKEKGKYVTEPEIFKDQSMRIVTHAVKKFFVDGVPVEKTINECNDLKMFIMGRRAKTGSLEWREAVDLTTLRKEALPKNVRYYVSKTGGSIVKVLKNNKIEKEVKEELKTQLDMFSTKKSKKKNLLKLRYVSTHKGYRVTLFNRWTEKPFEKYGVDKQFYLNEALKLIDPILNTQSTL